MADILLIGENRENAGGLRSLLRKDGHDVRWLRSSRQWSAVEREVRPDLIVAAVKRPDEVLSAPCSPARGFPAPLLFVQHDADVFQEVYLEDRLVDHLESPFMAEELLARADALVKVRAVVCRGRGAEAAENARRGLRGLGRRLSALMASRVPRYPKPHVPYLEVAARVAEWADRRDMFEPGHAGRVASFCAMMADALDFPDHEVEVLLRAAMLHDIGKVTLPVEILRHRGPLDEEQMRLVRTHAERGATLLHTLDPEDEAARVILYHHERPDGTGYHHKPPDAVPRAARVLAVAEAYDAMTAARWREPVTGPAALGLLKNKRGEQFDSEAVDALVESLKPRPGIPIRV